MNAPLRDWLREHPLPDPEPNPGQVLPTMDDDDTDD